VSSERIDRKERMEDSQDPQKLRETKDRGAAPESPRGSGRSEGADEEPERGSRESSPAGGSSKESPKPEAETSEDSGSDVSAEGERSKPEEGEQRPRVDARNLENSVVQAIENQRQTIDQRSYTHLEGFFAEGRLPEHDLRREDFDEIWSAERLGGLEGSSLIDEDQVTEVLARLERFRVLLLAGPRGLGKGGLGLLAATRITIREGLEEVLGAGALDRSVRLRTDSLFDAEGEYSRRVLFFEDFHDDGNPSLGGLIRRLDAPRLQALTGQLETAGSYLVLTSAPDRLPDRLERLRSLGIAFEIQPPSEADLVRVLKQQAALRRVELDRRDPDLAGQVDAVLDEHGRRLAVEIRTIPRAVRFVDELLIPLAQGELTLEQAMDRLDDVERWLLSELPRKGEDSEDRTLWSFTLALVLASAHPHVRWVPWTALHTLWRVVEKVLDRELGGGPDGEVPSVGRPLGRLIVDRPFLDRVRAEAGRLAYPIGEAVRFCDPATADRLWRVLLGPGRALLSTFASEVTRLAGSEDPVLRRIAARCLGRMGELQPQAIVLPRFERWQESGSDEDSFAMGEMAIGALASDDRDYVNGCLERLRRVVETAVVEGSTSGFMALVPLGLAEDEWVFETLEVLLEKRLGEPERQAPPVSRRMHQFVEEISGEQRALDHLSAEVLQEVALATMAQNEVSATFALHSVQYVLVGLCFGGDPISVFEYLSRWLKESSAIAPWLSLMILRERGMLEILEDHPLPAPSDHEEPERAWDRGRISRILLAADDEESVRVLARFLERTFEACEPFPARLRDKLRRDLVELLAGWTLAAAPSEQLRPRMVVLLRSLVESSVDTLGRDVFALLNRDPRMTLEGSDEESLAREALRSWAAAS
jgi:hypothetical protein